MKATRIHFGLQYPLHIEGFPALFTSYIREWAANRSLESGIIADDADMHQMYSDYLAKKYREAPELSADAIYRLATEETNGKNIPSQILDDMNIGVCIAWVDRTERVESTVIVSRDHKQYAEELKEYAKTKRDI